MPNTAATPALTLPHTERCILAPRAQRFMLDADRALLCGLQTKVPVQAAVKRNAVRLPSDFRFQLEAVAWAALRPRLVASNGRGAGPTAPYALMEHGRSRGARRNSA